jgi:mutator protein MutT
VKTNLELFRNSSNLFAVTHRPPIEVSAGLVFRAGKLLITQRFPEAHQGGLWEFPGGKREPNETFEQCLARELREELDIEVTIHELVETITHAYPEKTVTLKFFRCAWKANEPRPIGCPDFRWVTRDELVQFAFPPADARLLGDLRRHSEWWK